MPTKDDKKKITRNIKDLIALKIKADYFSELLKEKIEDVKKEMSSSNIDVIEDEGMIVSLRFRKNPKRIFNVAGVRKVLGTKAFMCIEESVSAEKFDAIVKVSDEYTITEQEQSLCFTWAPGFGALNWDGLDAYKKILLKEEKEKKDKKNGK